jgi:alpha-tubulin suppressor-like RCC1 family protein
VTAANLTFAVSGTITKPRVRITGTLAKVLKVRVANLQKAGSHWVIPGEVAVPIRNPLASYTGIVTIYDGSKKLAAALKVKVRTKKPSATTIPSGASAPTAQRIGSLSATVQIVKDEVLVLLGDTVADPAALIRTIAKRTGAVIQGAIPDLRIYQLRYSVTTIAQLDAKAAAVRAFTGVSTAWYDPVVAESRLPNDPGWDSWTSTAPTDNNWALKHVNAPAAWDLTTGSKSVTIGVVDRAVDSNPPDIATHLIATGKAPQYDGDDHGTMVAGTACAVGDNGIGVTGLMWDCRIRSFAIGGAKTATISTVAEAMNRAVDAGVDIVNASVEVPLGGLGVDEANAFLAAPIKRALTLNKDILWVFAAGNDHTNVANVSPASLVEQFPLNTMAVAATTPDDIPAGFSNYGDLISVGAPGVGIYSTLGSKCTFFGGCVARYGSADGTSLAAPIVSGIAGLVKAAHPGYKASMIKSCIVLWGSRRMPGNPYGLIDAHDSVVCEPPAVPLSVEKVTLADARVGATYTALVTATGGTRPFRWSASSLPAGLSINAATGEISGTPTGPAGDASITATVSDAVGTTASKDFWLRVESDQLTARSVDAAWRNSCAITKLNRVVCWGNNEAGQVGDGSASDASAPRRVGSLEDAVSVVASDNHACALLANGEVWCWGAYWYGQLGNGVQGGSSAAFTGTPVLVSTLPSASAITAGNDGHTCAVAKVGGGVWCWGFNVTMQLGDPDFTASDSPTPRQVPGLSGVIAVDAGENQTCAIRSDHSVVCWGGSFAGEPVEVPELAGSKAISVGGFSHICVITDLDQAKCVGGNWLGDELGGGPGVVPEPGLTGVAAIATGGDHACALMEGSGQIKCWGRNSYGQLGDGTTETKPELSTVSGLSGAKSISAGSGHTCAIGATDLLMCWGDNSAGQLGVGDTGEHLVPTVVVGSN